MQTYNAKKEPHFIEAYKKHFDGLTPKRVLEIGVQHGGSLKIWRDMFPDAEIVGVDIDPQCKQYEETNIKVLIGDQHDVKFLESLGDFDIIIDDGGHTMTQQQTSLKWLMPQLREGGIYVIEDLHVYADQSPRCTKKRGLENKYRVTSMSIYPGIVFIFK